MKNNNLLIILLVLFVTICICPFLIAIFFILIDTLLSSSAGGTLGTLFLVVLCLVPIVIASAGLASQIVNLIRSPKAARRLAEQIDLQPLNEAPKAMAVWYGGRYGQRKIALKPTGSSYRYYSEGRSRVGVRFYLRMVVEVQVEQPLAIMVRRPARGGSKNPTNFTEAFELQNGDKLNEKVQEMMWAFIEKGYKTGLQGIKWRFSKGRRNLYLLDRDAAPEGMLIAQVMPATQVILIHDHPDPNIDKEVLLDLLDDMALICSAIEKQFVEEDPL